MSMLPEGLRGFIAGVAVVGALAVGYGAADFYITNIHDESPAEFYRAAGACITDPELHLNGINYALPDSCQRFTPVFPHVDHNPDGSSVMRPYYQVDSAERLNAKLTFWKEAPQTTDQEWHDSRIFATLARTGAAAGLLAGLSLLCGRRRRW